MPIISVKNKRGTAAEWAAANPVLEDGELGFEEDTKVIKIGDGVTNWVDLPSALSGTYDPLRLIGPKYLKTFNAKKAKRATSPIDIVFMGDSKTEGTGATNPATRWQALVLSAMRAKWQSVGIVGGFGYIPAVYVSPSLTAYSPILSGGASAKITPTSNSTYGLGKRSVLLNGAGQTITFNLGPITVFGRITDADICYVQGSGQGTFTVTVDGGAPVTVTATNVAAVYNQRFHIAGLDRNVGHTITIAWSSGIVNIEGLMAYDGDYNLGIRSWDAGHHGVSASQISITNAEPWAAIGQIAPALLWYMMGRNDFSGGQPIQTIIANVTAHINAIRSACIIPPSIILGIDYADAEINAVSGFDSWYTAMKGIAKADGNIAILDLYKRMGTLNNAVADPLGILDIDHIHLSSTVGHQMMADAFIDLLTAV